MRLLDTLSRVALLATVASIAAAQSQGLKLPPLDPNARLPAPPPRTPGPGEHLNVLPYLIPLKPLQKVHYSFAVEDSWLSSAADPLVREYVRLTHALCVSGERVTGPQLDVAAAICAGINADRPELPASIGVNFSIWHRRFPKDLPPTDTGPRHDEELGFFRGRMEQVRDWLAEINRRRGSAIEVTAVLLDCERFDVRDANEPGAAEWNEAVRNKHDLTYRVSKEVFPKARVIWYALGGFNTRSTGNCWVPARFAPPTILNDCWCVSLYRPHEQHYTREQMIRTVAAARAAGVKDVVPWVSLAAGYRRQVKGPAWKFDNNWDYGLAIAWQQGAEINIPWYAKHADCYAPWDAAPVVCFYPGPYYKRHWLWPQYFVAYVRGANDVKDLDDIPMPAQNLTPAESGAGRDRPSPDGVDDPT